MTPVFPSSPVQRAHTRSVLVGGSSVSNAIVDLSRARGFTPASIEQLYSLKMIKETRTYVRPPSTSLSLDAPPQEIRIAPDRTIELADELHLVLEAFFRPSELRRLTDYTNTTGDQPEGPPVQDLVRDAVAQFSPEQQQFLMSNIVLVGGSAGAAGFKERLAAELGVPMSAFAAVRAPYDVPEIVWYGLSVLASLPMFGERCWTKEVFERMYPGALSAGALKRRERAPVKIITEPWPVADIYDGVDGVDWRGVLQG